MKKKYIYILLQYANVVNTRKTCNIFQRAMHFDHARYVKYVLIIRGFRFLQWRGWDFRFSGVWNRLHSDAPSSPRLRDWDFRSSGVWNRLHSDAPSSPRLRDWDFRSSGVWNRLHSNAPFSPRLRGWDFRSSEVWNGLHSDAPSSPRRKEN